VLDAIPPERLITPTPFGTPGLNHCRAFPRDADHAHYGLARTQRPQRVRPRNIALFAFATAAISIASHTGTRSGTKHREFDPVNRRDCSVFYTGRRHKHDRDIDLPNEFTAS